MKSSTEALQNTPSGPLSGRVPGSEARACPNCGSVEFEALFPVRDFDTGCKSYPVRRCRRCELCYTGEVSDDELAKIYSRSYYGSATAKFLSVIEMLVRLGHRRQARKILDLYHGRTAAPSVAGGKVSVLDIGCGRALLLREFDRLGAECTGIERGEFPGEGTSRIEVHVGALHDAELADKRFDIIVLWHVLEHITDLGILFEALPGHLNPGGLLVVSVPNLSSWQSRFFERHWFHLDIPRHVAHFEKRWLQDRLASMGLEIVAQTTFTASQNVYGFLQSSLNRVFPQRQNRLYHLLSRRQGGQDWLALLAWASLAIPVMPFALLESLLAAVTGRGATLTIYARNRIGDGEDSV